MVKRRDWKTVNDLEEQANMAKQEAEARTTLTDAEQKIARASNSEQNLRDREADVYARARARRLNARADLALADPGRFSPFERKALIDWRNRNEPENLREHEMNMLKQKGANEIGVAEQKRFGMAEQGMKAAEFGANAEIKKAETEWGARKDIAQTEADAKKYGADRGLTAAELEWGKTGADGTRIGGGREAVAGIEGKSRVDAAREQARIAAEQNEQKRALEEQKLRAAQEKERANLKYKYDRLTKDTKDKIDAQANALAKEKGISFEEARDQIMAAREQAAQQGGATKEGDTKTLSSGRKVVFTNGKWQYAD